MRMNVNRPYHVLGLGKVDADYCLQDGVIFCWSESNIGYEKAWWLNPDGSPSADTEHVRNLLRDRPFDPAWLKVTNENFRETVRAIGVTDFTSLRPANAARQEEWDPTGFAKTRSWRFNELGGEVGEVCNILKKLHRESCGVPGSRATKDQLADELADVVICIDLAAMECLVDPLLYDVPAVPRLQFTDLTHAGNCLLARMGLVSSTFLDNTEHPAELIKMRLKSLLNVVRCIAYYQSIDLEMAVINKFNFTSSKVGLRTRLTAN
jgi:NTP pyrophosphatase (non-canonical NTP hydrolase)